MQDLRTSATSAPAPNSDKFSTGGTDTLGGTGTSPAGAVTDMIPADDGHDEALGGDDLPVVRDDFGNATYSCDSADEILDKMPTLCTLSGPERVMGFALPIGNGDGNDAISGGGTDSDPGSVVLNDGTLLTFSEIETRTRLAPGHAARDAPPGARAIAMPATWDMVATRNHGLLAIRWVGQRTVAALGAFTPVRLRARVVTGLEQALLVSPPRWMPLHG